MTTRIDLDGNPYSTEGNLKGVQSSESDLSALLCADTIASVDNNSDENLKRQREKK